MMSAADFAGRGIHAGFNGAGVFRPRKCPTSRTITHAGMPRRFNGAGVFRPRKCGRSDVRAGLQWGRGLSTPEIRDPGRDGESPIRRFNGAGVFRPRKCVPAIAASRCFNGARPRASMGPGSFDPGNGRRIRRFLASMGPGSFDPGNRSLQWGRGLSTPEISQGVSIWFSKSWRRVSERRLARRAGACYSSAGRERNLLQTLYISPRERLCFFSRRFAARNLHRVTKTGYSSSSPSSVFASSRV